MALNPLALEASKASSKHSKTHVGDKDALADKSLFKTLLEGKKAHVKPLHALETPHDLKSAKNKKKHDKEVFDPNLLALADTKKTSLPELSKKTHTETKEVKKDTKNLKENLEKPTLGDIKKLENAKKLKLSALKHEKSAPKTEAQTEKPPLSTQNLLNMKALKNKKSASTKTKETKAPKEHTTDQKTQAHKQVNLKNTPLSQLLAQHMSKTKTDSKHEMHKPLNPHFKDNATNDREIKQAFKEAFEKFPPTPLTTALTHLQGPMANKPTQEGEKEESKIAIKESSSHAHVQHSNHTDKETPKAPQIKETLKNFATELKQELQNFKPPINKLSMELHPDKLGKVEVVIQQVGKNIQVSVASSAPVSALLSAHNAELRQNLSQMGFNNVDVSFITQDGQGFSNNPQQQQSQQDHANQGTSTPTQSPNKEESPPPSTSEPPKSAGLYA
ncbi:flagellar hook-length control protein FliK [Helicobacter cynogastricus]|uniref:flagellar hook-length control protein FliK n=1 Tax=Helicobacter cynogastricus TaxID=329937 RepID=UPI000CF13D29|nr:flagellar hook-length control protein FliK [Helicobacter cynogastricus]